jgi:hypothetical protein
MDARGLPRASVNESFFGSFLQKRTEALLFEPWPGAKEAKTSVLQVPPT